MAEVISLHRRGIFIQQTFKNLPKNLNHTKIILTT
jgi:hypothetical protein